MLALKLKLEPTEEQLPLLDAMFVKWAYLATRAAKQRESWKDDTKNMEKKAPIFTRTQIAHKIQDDIKAAEDGLEHQGRRIGREIERKQEWLDYIKKLIEDETVREYNPKGRGSFRMKGRKGKFRTLKAWNGTLEENEKVIKKKKTTLERIKNGLIKYKPTRITLWESTYSFDFSGKNIELRILEDTPLTISYVDAPFSEKGSSNKASAEYIKNAIRQFVIYALHSHYFVGFRQYEKAWFKSSKPESREKAKAALQKKIEKVREETPKLAKKFLGKELDLGNADWIEDAVKREIGGEGGPHGEYLKLLEKMADKILNDGRFNPEKYLILLRKPLKSKMYKKLANLKPNEWKYYVQITYEPLYAERGVEEKTIMGIDRGVSHLLAISVLDPKTGRFFENQLVPNPVKNWRRERRKLRASIRNTERSVRAETGQHIQEAQIKKRLKSITDRVDDYYHNVSRNVIDLAKKHKSAIVFEDLGDLRVHARKKSKYVKERDYVLSLFDYQGIYKLIEYKARKEGLTVYVVDPIDTSNRCAKCLIKNYGKSEYQRGIKTNPNDRYGNPKVGKCVNCCGEGKDYQIDADLNAARVIALCKQKGINNPRRVS